MAYYGCLLTHSAVQNIPTSTIQHVSFDTELFDIGGFHSAAPYPERITIPTGYGGYYLIHVQIQWEQDPTGDRHVDIWKNGAALFRALLPAVTNSDKTMEFALPYALAAGDYIVCYVWQDCGTGLDIQRTAAPYTPLFGVDYLGS
jgi:hypothetical protein